MRKTLTCSECHRVFVPREDVSIHVHFTQEVDPLTGTMRAIDEWVDFCSQRCHDAALRRPEFSTAPAQ